jgi:hypothetical protein
MCTLTYIPNAQGAIITQNRDESPLRTPAVFPIFESELCFPKDPDGGGTWMGMRRDGIVVSLLNGAFIPHQRKPSYKKSRGLLTLQALRSPQPNSFLNKEALLGLEAFTMVIFQKDVIVEFRWDENELFQCKWPTSQPLIWQSAPLYDAAMQKVRELWFRQFLLSNLSPSADEVLQWATNRSIETPHKSICMKRDEVETVSISQILKHPDNIEMRYLDLNSNEVLKVMLQTK